MIIMIAQSRFYREITQSWNSIKLTLNDCGGWLCWRKVKEFEVVVEDECVYCVPVEIMPTDA